MSSCYRILKEEIPSIFKQFRWLPLSATLSCSYFPSTYLIEQSSYRVYDNKHLQINWFMWITQDTELDTCFWGDLQGRCFLWPDSVFLASRPNNLLWRGRSVAPDCIQISAIGGLSTGPHRSGHNDTAPHYPVKTIQWKQQNTDLCFYLYVNYLFVSDCDWIFHSCKQNFGKAYTLKWGLK